MGVYNPINKDTLWGYLKYPVRNVKGVILMADKSELKTKDYVLRAQKNYANKFDIVKARLPKGSAEIIREVTGKSVNAYITELVLQDMKENYNTEL